MQCPICKHDRSRVVYILHKENDEKVTRRRECTKCGMRFNTQEVMKEYKYKSAPNESIAVAK